MGFQPAHYMLSTVISFNPGSNFSISGNQAPGVYDMATNVTIGAVGTPTIVNLSF